MNHHLHLFNFYHESEEPKFIENNLTRAFALCLKHDPVLLYAFLREVLSPEDYNFLFYVHEKDTSIDFDMQIETSTLVDETRKLYAIGLTDTTAREDWTGIEKDIDVINKMNITDLVISIKDIKIIFEVKRTGEDCKEQLRQQIAPFTYKQHIQVTPMHYTWSDMLHLIEQISNFYTYNGQSNQFINSFLQLVKARFSHWVPTKPFKFQPFFKDSSDLSGRQPLIQRLHNAVQSIGRDQIDILWDRTAIKVGKPWATEAIPDFIWGNDGKQYLIMDIWPGNVKQQGYALYSMPLDWVNAEMVTINGEVFEVEVDRHIKFMHFNKYITSLDIPIAGGDRLLKKEINTPANLHQISGKWYRDDWPKLIETLDEYFSFDWKQACKWEQNFEDSARSYLTLSLGYCCRMYVPYSYLQGLDSNQQGHVSVGMFLAQCKDAMVSLIEG
ncbi:hypothetical protein SAMN05428949_6234 [Chitinophaga sp. YR627]|uniref:hypothetical protein n=1 Tax=Chitinophaga sp. YR627 TaxID=1881041 RepID=UPI0008E68436|nr:hypothetical protein [Chitinophaga sp. YR627]SFO69889.1 hypothetical protein SAMN05428949_6234 [Chitinophaga sp. YR627]